MDENTTGKVIYVDFINKLILSEPVVIPPRNEKTNGTKNR